MTGCKKSSEAVNLRSFLAVDSDSSGSQIALRPARGMKSHESQIKDTSYSTVRLIDGRAKFLMAETVSLLLSLRDALAQLIHSGMNNLCEYMRVNQIASLCSSQVITRASGKTIRKTQIKPIHTYLVSSSSHHPNWCKKQIICCHQSKLIFYLIMTIHPASHYLSY